MLNVAVIRSVAYYLDQVAHSRADYYLGRGEAPGRWRGALAPVFGLAGKVDPEALRALLEGRHPATGETFLPVRAVPARAGATPGNAAATMSAAEAAEALGVSTRTVRRWAAAGEAAWREAEGGTPGKELRTTADVRQRLAELGSTAVQPGALTCLLVAPVPGRRHRVGVPVEEVERLRELRKAPSARQGYDVVFRPAKGWSVLWAVGPLELRQELRRIHHQAVDDALAYLEDSAARGPATVMWRDRRVRVRARGEGFVVACFDHRESRAGDPLLHTHCLIANVTRLPDGRLGALEASGLFRQQRAADAVYRATFLRLASQRLGIRPAPGDDPFPEPEGVPRPVVEHFSKRSDEISEEVARHGSASAAARQLAALATRRAKEVAARSEDLHDRWRSEANAIGFGAAQVAACVGHPEVLVPTEAQRTTLELALAAPEGLTEKGATFFRGDAVRGFADGFPGAMSGPEVVAAADAFLASNAVIQVREHRPGRPRGRVLEAGGVVDDLAVACFSVPELADAEARLITAADRASGPTIDLDVIETVLGRFTHLSVEQADMVRSVCQATTLLRPVVGLPGSGKTTAAAALVATCHAASVPVVGCAVTATAADELGRRTGLANCDTLAHTLVDLQSPEGLAPGTMVMADEASMLPTRALERLVDRVEAAGGTLVLIGDPHQHPAVGPGSFFAWLTRNRDAPTLAGNLRQIGPSVAVEHEAAALLRQGQVAAALRVRDQAGLVTRASTPAELHDRLVADWQWDWDANRDPMIAASNETRERLNLAARALLATAGVLHGPTWTTSGGREFQAGDWVVARHNDRRLRSLGDRRFFVRNGACGEIIEVDEERGEIVVDFAGPDDAPRRVRLPSNYVDVHLEHGYALTDYGVQGRTLARSLAVLENASTTPGAYVATTRGRHENRVYLTDGGHVIDDSGLDASHGITRLQSPTMKELAARVAARQPDGMLHDRDCQVREAGALAAETDLRSLHEMLAGLDRELSNLPADGSRALESALAARRRLEARAQGATPGSPSAAKLAGQLSQLDASIHRLEVRQSRRAHALQLRESQLASRSLVADAAGARATKQRLSDRSSRGVRPPQP